MRVLNLTELTVILFLGCATLAWGMGYKPAARPPKTSAAFYDSRCGDAYRAVRWYRARYDQHRRKLGLRLAPPVEEAMSCRRLRARARYWIEAAAANRRAVLRIVPDVPTGEAAIRLMINDDCLEEIVRRETGGTWDPTIDYGFGHGNVYEAYGLPQAKPGTKMASAGADWRTNPATQIRWMRSYVNARYGGSCGALAFHNANGWY